ACSTTWTSRAAWRATESTESEQRLRHQVDHLEIARADRLSQDPLPPGVGEALDHRPGLIRRPEDPAWLARGEPGVPAPLVAERRKQRRLAPRELGVGAPDQDSGHHRPAHRGRVAPDRLAGGAQRRELLDRDLRRRRRQVELVRVAGRDAERPGRALAAGQEPRSGGTVRPDRPAGSRNGLRMERRVLDPDVLALERPAVLLAPQSVEDGELLLAPLHASA